ncbi:MAG: PAS domain S-box protein [Anaerolineales bacterium]|nr:PAS domain S-box protein [Anaerolineales bacterium]
MPDFISTVIADEDRTMFIKRFQEAIHGNQGENFEFRYLHKNGTKRWLSASWQPIYDAQGNPLGARSSGYDITERKLAEMELKESERRLRETNLDLKRAEAEAHIGNWKWNLRTATVEWSDEMFRIFGVDRDSYTGRLADVISKVIHPDDLHIVLPSNASAFASNQPQEYRIIRPTDGTVRHIWAKAGDSILDEQGNPLFLTGVAQDITERKQAEEALSESEEHYRLLANNVPDVIYSLDGAGNIVAVNSPAFERYGYTEQNSKGKPFLDFIHPEDREIVIGSFLKALEQQRKFTKGPNSASWLRTGSAIGLN